MNNLIDNITDKDGIEVEIEIKNLEAPITIAGREMTIVAEFRYAKNSEIVIYGSSIYFQGEHFTQDEMKELMEKLKINIDERKF